MVKELRLQVLQRTNPVLLDHLLNIRQMSHQELEADFKETLHDPFLLPDMKEAIEILETAAKKKWSVFVFGDYDADGTPGAALLVRMLRRLKLTVGVGLASRELGYGLHPEQIPLIVKDHQLLITVDNGITSHEAISAAVAAGVQVIVLDHHLPKDSLPPAQAVVDAYRDDSRYPFLGLCGCGLAYKFLEAARTRFPELSEGFCKWQLDLVAISTVADMMELRGENRTLVRYGLEVIKKTKNIGLQALINAADLEIKKIEAGSLGWVIGPRLNASGRLGDNRPALDLLITEDRSQAEDLALELERSNRKRQAQVRDVLEEVEKELWAENSAKDKFLLVRGENWPTGIIGLVAGKITAKYNRPVILVSQKDEILKGSGRSPDFYRIIDALTSAAEHLSQFGGHASAVGLSLKAENWLSAAAAIKKHAEASISDEQLKPIRQAEAVLTLDEINQETVHQLERLAPFGYGNPRPKFLLDNWTVKNITPIGRTDQHFRYLLGKDGFELEAIEFFAQAPSLIVGSSFHILGELSINRFNGKDKLQFKISDCLPSDQKYDTVEA